MHISSQSIQRKRFLRVPKRILEDHPTYALLGRTFQSESGTFELHLEFQMLSKFDWEAYEPLPNRVNTNPFLGNSI